jgi:hypothetical protein
MHIQATVTSLRCFVLPHPEYLAIRSVGTAHSFLTSMHCYAQTARLVQDKQCSFYLEQHIETGMFDDCNLFTMLCFTPTPQVST